VQRRVPSGIAEAALDACVSYSKDRMLFGRSLSNLEAIRFLIAEMATRIEAARLLTYRAACVSDRGEEFIREASMAKLFATRRRSGRPRGQSRCTAA